MGDSIGVKDQEIANLQQQLATANDIFKSLQTKTYSDGRVYVGQVKDGKAHGFGKMTYANGNVYVGDWKDDKKDGKGTYTCADGNVYDGEWKDDKINGYGKHTKADGSIWHDGMWKDFKPV